MIEDYARRNNIDFFDSLDNISYLRYKNNQDEFFDLMKIHLIKSKNIITKGSPKTNFC